MALATTSCYSRAILRGASLSRICEDALSRSLGEAHLKRLCGLGGTTPSFFGATRTRAVSTNFRKKKQLNKPSRYMHSFLTAKDAQRLIGGPGSAGLTSNGELHSNRFGNLASINNGHKLNSHGKRTSVTASASTSEVQTKTDMEEQNAVEGDQHVSEASSALTRTEGGERRRYKAMGDVHKEYEQDMKLLPGCWIVVRVDGRAFHRFVQVHGFARPHDRAAIGLMDAAARAVVEEFTDIVFAYGQSDEYSFVFHKDTDKYSRRSSKFSTLVASLFTSHYVMNWPSFFATPLMQAPSFDGRAVCYPSLDLVRDYVAWRQLDCHTNCLSTTCYWTLVDKGGKTAKQAAKILDKASTAFKNELLFSEFGINYNDLPPVFKRGTILVKRRERLERRTKEASPFCPAGTPYYRTLMHIDTFHEEVARGDFWLKHCPALLSDPEEEA